MISFIQMCQDLPYVEFRSYYEKALKANQKNIEAIAISSFSKDNNFVDSRFVNLKFINEKEFIFFSNYSSPKSKQFETHPQISALLFWSEINIQIRIIANIKRKDSSFNNNYFRNRGQEKNALAIASHQSTEIDSFQVIKNEYKKVLKNNDLTICPSYWGGFSFIPTSFEFWEGHKNRLNIRKKYYLIDSTWVEKILSP